MRRLREASQSDTGGDGYNDNSATDEEDAMISANDELASFAEELNSFYGHPKNRKLVNSSQVFVHSFNNLLFYIFKVHQFKIFII